MPNASVQLVKMKLIMSYNINGIFILIITLLVISTFSRSNFEQLEYKQSYRTVDNGYFSPLVPLKSTSNPVTRHYEIELSQVNLAPDGFTKTVFSIDGQYPGTIIRANKGDSIRVKVTNKLGFPTGKFALGCFTH